MVACVVNVARLACAHLHVPGALAAHLRRRHGVQPLVDVPVAVVVQPVASGLLGLVAGDGAVVGLDPRSGVSADTTPPRAHAFPQVRRRGGADVRIGRFALGGLRSGGPAACAVLEANQPFRTGGAAPGAAWQVRTWTGPLEIAQAGRRPHGAHELVEPARDRLPVHIDPRRRAERHFRGMAQGEGCDGGLQIPWDHSHLGGQTRQAQGCLELRRQHRDRLGGGLGIVGAGRQAELLQGA